ncbi:MAG TPA: tRNA (5-methylaminomethyl-2-thiouridine)(34)-methyltransferase MnmD, partial [Quisquiliibacterium sp.]|nr:tRNA (5-methylaminomethyl-2-thiouridine)(34)-methyltransferase MnmD [Quisquiliibacterium sp.]
MPPSAVPPDPGDLGFDDAGRPYSPRYGDVYRSHAGAFAEARTVFVEGCGIEADWRGRARFAIVELGFGLGVNFLATLAAWRADPRRPDRLDFVSVERHPLGADELARALEAVGAGGADAQALLAQWPMPLPGLHRLSFADHRVTLTLAIGDAAGLAGLLPVAADAFYLDGFAPARNPGMWTPALMKSLARLARPGAALATYTAARSVREALGQAGFEVSLVPGFAGKRERIVARYAPRWRSFAPPPAAPDWPVREAVVVGGGLAGCAAGAALAGRGWRVIVLERGAQPAGEGSAQPAVADHLHVAPDDNPLARLSRAALLLERSAHPHSAPAGKLQVADGAAEFDRQTDCVRALAFPAGFLQALGADAAADAAGLRLSHGGLWLPLCGSADPVQRCLDLLRAPGGALEFRSGAEVARLQREGAGWLALGADGGCLAAAPVIVLANAGDALRLAAQQATSLRRVRGQTTVLRRGALPGLRAVLGGDAYACPLPDGSTLVGSTFDDGESLEPDPHADLSNLRRLARMLAPGDADPRSLLARAG